MQTCYREAMKTLPQRTRSSKVKLFFCRPPEVQRMLGCLMQKAGCRRLQKCRARPCSCLKAYLLALWVSHALPRQAIQECTHPDVRDRALLYYRPSSRSCVSDNPVQCASNPTLSNFIEVRCSRKKPGFATNFNLAKPATVAGASKTLKRLRNRIDTLREPPLLSPFYACMYVYIYTHIHAHLPLYIYIYIYIYLHTHI